MTYPTISALPTAPDRTQPSTFSTRADALVAALSTFVTETNAAGDYIESASVSADADASSASTSAGEAAASAAAAAQEASKWSSGASYTEGDVVWSDLSYFTYRATETHTPQSVDPSLPTAWEIESNIEFIQEQSIVSGPIGTIYNDLFFRSDGLKMYFIIGGFVEEYDLSVAWDVSTASSLQDYDASAESAQFEGLFFKPDGTKMWLLGSDDAVYQYTLSSAWDVSSASYDGDSLAASTENRLRLFFKSDGTKMYFIDFSNSAVEEYDLSSAWDITSAAFSNSFSLRSSLIDNDEVGLSFKDDGTNMYVINGTLIDQYDLSVAWDTSSASFSASHDITDTLPGSTSSTVISALFFKPDGVTFYIINNSNIEVAQFEITGNRFWRNISGFIREKDVPTSATDTGNRGDISWDTDYLYICVAQDTWKRVAISSW